jgi:hypothetical protein
MKPSCATDTHWIGGVRHPGGELLNGWPCCCSGECAHRIMSSGAPLRGWTSLTWSCRSLPCRETRQNDQVVSFQPLTFRIALVTCKRCLRVMRKSHELCLELDELTTKGPRT